MSQANRNGRWTLADWDITEGWVKTYPVGRVCDCGCGTVLSRYNSETTCDAHQPAPDYLSYLGVKFTVCDRCDKIDVAAKAFRRMPDGGRSTTCLSCERQATRAKDRATKERANRAKAVRGVVRGCLRIVKCSKCGHAQTATSDNFAIRADGRRSSTCLVCDREYKARRYATDPAYRERAKASARASKARCKARGNS